MELVLEIKFYSQQTAMNMIEVGKRLLEAKKQVSRGEWGRWLKDNFKFSHMTASRFMNAAAEAENLTSMLNLDPTKIIALLDLPAEQRESFIQSNPVDEMTTRQVQAAIKAQKEAECRAEEYEVKNEHLRQANKLLEDKLKSVGEPIVVERPIQVFPPDYERIKRENIELKTRQPCSNPQQPIRPTQHSEDELEKTTRRVVKILSALLDLPSEEYMEEIARCYLRESPADPRDEITVTCSQIETATKRLQTLNQALKNAMKLKAVK